MDNIPSSVYLLLNLSVLSTTYMRQCIYVLFVTLCRNSCGIEKQQQQFTTSVLSPSFGKTFFIHHFIRNEKKKYWFLIDNLLSEAICRFRSCA